MTLTAPTRRESSPSKTPPPKLPFWLRTPPKKPRAKAPAPGPRQIRWWIGVVWFLVAGLLLGFVGHVTGVGVLQHLRSQHLLYEQLRTDLAKAVTPLGQLDFNEKLVAFGTPIGVITIPSIGVTEVVVQGTRPSDLTTGPGHRRDTVYPGQTGTSVIMGRQTTYGGPFRALKELAPGDKITVTTGQGVQKFTVFGIRRGGDLLPQPLSKGEGRLELVTADGLPLAPSGTLHIDASLDSKAQETPSPVFTKEVLDPSELELASDTGSWFSSFFWLQWLVVAAIALRWARGRWGVWQTWIVGIPLVLVLGAATADSAISTLANLL
jgi:LPXTG-site transpeptidase (sortase) family protein